MPAPNDTGPTPAFLLSVPTSTEAEAQARRLARLEALAVSLRSAAADCPPNDPELRSRIMAAGTAAAQLVAHLRRAEVSHG